MAHYEQGKQEAAHPIPISLPPMPHCPVTVLRIGKTWNACVFVIESPRGRSAKRPRCVAPRYLSRSAPEGLSITKTHAFHVVRT